MATSATFTDASPVTSLSSGGYATQYNVNDIFGASNVEKWANASADASDSNAGFSEITRRVKWAITSATADFENAMRQGRYELPITGAGACVWATNVVSILAGEWLYSRMRHAQRGPDGKPMACEFEGYITWAQLQMDYVRSGKLRLDASVFGKGTNAPFVTHHHSHSSYGSGQHGHSLSTGPFVG